MHSVHLVRMQEALAPMSNVLFHANMFSAAPSAQAAVLCRGSVVTEQALNGLPPCYLHKAQIPSGQLTPTLQQISKFTISVVIVSKSNDCCTNMV